MVLWFTGQPGSGKTTLTNRFIEDKLIGFMKIQPVRIVHIDGDDLRDVLDNKDYSEKGRRKNIQFAIDMTKVLDDKGFIVIVSLVSPYRDMREKLKSNRNIAEFYLHTTDIRGKEDYFVEDYEPPLHNYVDINTDKTIEECLDEVLNVYRQMATVA
jgi:adenylylsulfate kinase-like enzyme|tara:strand:- start:976 stop:1443 length:468 start_codon:yes stop_codon:yes gene_type:complete